MVADAAAASDAPIVPDVPVIQGVPDAPTAPTCLPLEGTWVGWWSYTESGRESRSNIELRFGGAGVTGQGIRPRGDIVNGARGPNGALRFTVRQGPEDVGFAFSGTLAEGCGLIRGSYASHFHGGRFELQRQVCSPPTRELALDGEEVVDNLTNAPIAVIADCNRAEPVLHHVFTLRVPRHTTVALSVASEDPNEHGPVLSLRADCASPETACVGANTELRRALDAGTYRVVVSSRITRWVPYRLRAVTAPAGG